MVKKWSKNGPKIDNFEKRGQKRGVYQRNPRCSGVQKGVEKGPKKGGFWTNLSKESPMIGEKKGQKMAILEGGGPKIDAKWGSKTDVSGRPFNVKKAGEGFFEKIATLEKCHFATLI